MPIAADIYYHLYEGSGEGQRPPVILIHGAGGTHLHWPPNLRRLPGFRMYALDLPGHGKSGGRGQQSIPDYVDILLAWMEAVGIYSGVFVGHSMGGAIAISLALEHPGQALGLGLVGTGGRLRVSPDLLEKTTSQNTFISAVGTLVKWSFSPNSPERLRELAAQRMAETRPSVMHGDFLACNTFDEMERIQELEQPTLVVCGAEDQMTPLRYSQYLADSIPNAKLKIIPEAGHMVMLEQPEATTVALNGFLSTFSY